MDLAQIRADIAAVMGALPAGTDGQFWQPYDYVPKAAGTLPCAVAGVPTSIEYFQTMGGNCQLELPLDLYVSLADARDGQRRLDYALSTKNGMSVYDAFKTKTDTRTAAWSQFQITGSGNPRLVAMGDHQALAMTVDCSIRA